MVNSGRSENEKLDFPQSLLRAEYLPPMLSLEVTNKCNVSCIMCDQAQKIRKSGERPPVVSLTTEKLRMGLEGIKRVKIANLSAGHGEPFLNREIVDIIRLLKSKNAWVEVITNGTLLTRSMSEKIIGAGLDRVFVSLHGAKKETHEGIMLNASFDKIIDNLKGLRELKAESSVKWPIVEILFVAMKRNVAELPDMIHLAAELGASTVHIESLNEREQEGLVEMKGESLVWHPELLTKEYERANDIARSNNIRLLVNAPYSSVLAGKSHVSSTGNRLPEGKTRYCLFPFAKPFMGIDGSVSLCCSSEGRYVRMGNAGEQGFYQVWDNDKYVNLRRALLTGENIPPYCDRCERAPVTDVSVMKLDMALLQLVDCPNAGTLSYVIRNMIYYRDYVKAMNSIGCAHVPLPNVKQLLIWAKRLVRRKLKVG